MSKIHKSAEVDITDPTEDNRRELFEEERILARVDSLPDPFKGYCSWLFLGSIEIVSALLDGRDLVAYVGELDMEDADSARQIEICIAIAGRLRRAAAAFSREYKSADILEAFSSDFADEIAEDNPLAEIFQDFWNVIMTLIVGKSGAYREELLKDTFSKTDLPKVKQKSLLKVFENLCEVLSRLDEAEMPPLPAEAVPNDVITACCEKLSANLRSLYGYVHNALCAYIQDRTDDRLSVLDEILQNANVEDDLIELMLLQVGYSRSVEQVFQPGVDQVAGLRLEEVSFRIRPLVEKLADADDLTPLVEVLQILYECACSLYGVEYPMLSAALAAKEGESPTAIAALTAESIFALRTNVSDQEEEMCCDKTAAECWTLIREQLSTLDAHYLRLLLTLPTGLVFRLDEEPEVLQEFLKVVSWPSADHFRRYMEMMSPLAELSTAAVEDLGELVDAPRSLAERLFPQTETASLVTGKDLSRFVAQVPKAFSVLPAEFLERLRFAFLYADIVFRGILKLPVSSVNRLYGPKMPPHSTLRIITATYFMGFVSLIGAFLKNITDEFELLETENEASLD